jgi:lipoprotein-anchoring transpeptidase ErfK/SrfK
MKPKFLFIIIFLLSSAAFKTTYAASLDFDNDGLTDNEENLIYRTNPDVPDTDGDGFSDGEEVKYLYDPNAKVGDKLEKTIVVDLEIQNLSYALGHYIVDSFPISSGTRNRTPRGDFSILVKKPVVTYKGVGYFYPNTRWNMMFKKQTGGSLYIHGAWWHNNFGQPMSHGCINVAYKDIERLYNWADLGTKVVVK